MRHVRSGARFYAMLPQEIDGVALDDYAEVMILPGGLRGDG